MKEVAVIGAGVSGLAAACRLMELRRQGKGNFRVHVFEASDTAGGSLKTRVEHGCVLEAGPDSMVTDKPWGVDLCKRLGLGDRLVGTNPACRKSFVMADGRLVSVPEGFYLMAPVKWRPWITTPILGWKGKFRALGERWVPRRTDPSDESVGDFVRRRFGKELLDRLAEPMLGGIYAADPDQLSMRAAFPRFVEMEERYGSLIKAMLSRTSKVVSGTGEASAAVASVPKAEEASGARYGLFVTVKGGMAAMVDAMVKEIPRGALRTGARVTQLERGAEGGWTIHTADGFGTVHAVIFASPAYATADLVRRFDPYLAQELEGIAYGGSATVNLIFRRRQIPHALDGFGYVVPARENRSVLGVTFSSIKFPSRAPEGWTVLRAFLGGDHRPALAGADEKEMERLVLEEIGQTLGIKAVPSFVWVNRYPKSMPRYRVGHLDRLRRIEEGIKRFPGLFLAGNAYRGIGVPDCVHSGEMASDAVTEYLRVTSSH